VALLKPSILFMPKPLSHTASSLIPDKSNFTPRIPIEYIRCSWLGVNAKVVWFVLISYANAATGECHPSLKTICTGANLNRRTVQRAIKELRTSRFLLILDSPRGRGKKSTHYRLLKGLEKVRQKVPSIMYHYDGTIEHISKDGLWYEKREGNKIVCLPIGHRATQQEMACHDAHRPDCDCGWCTRKNFKPSPATPERIMAAKANIDFPPLTPSPETDQEPLTPRRKPGQFKHQPDFQAPGCPQNGSGLH
jgi:hypothetical protein